MMMWRITKYNPQLRDVNGHYTADDWISVTDIGNTFGEKILSVEDYLHIEDAYVNTALHFLQASHTLDLRIQGLEFKPFIPEEVKQYKLDTLLYESDIMYDGQLISDVEIANACRLNLRELLWCKLEREQTFYIHFGYDYYMYIGSNEPCIAAISYAIANGLYVEEMPSPYFTAS